LNLSRQKAREKARTRSADEGYVPETPGEGFDAEEWSRRQSLRDAIAKLPAKLREAIILRYYSDYAPKEIAKILDIPLRTVYFRLECAQSRLGRLLNAEEGR
jgi:RNA polymerase sigma factor (sigma-70 family)